MPLPTFNEEGDLPPGVHRATLEETLERFGQGSIQRCAVAERRSASMALRVRPVTWHALSSLDRSSLPRKSRMTLTSSCSLEDRFDLAAVTGEAALPFQHMEADAHFGASVFWTRRSGAIGGEQAMIEYWQSRREGGRRGIIEIVREAS
jgi:hypothetical protein